MLAVAYHLIFSPAAAKTLKVSPALKLWVAAPVGASTIAASVIVND
ncbi:MAG: hypothetical protein WBY99_06575 [Kaistella sp.]